MKRGDAEPPEKSRPPVTGYAPLKPLGYKHESAVLNGDPEKADTHLPMVHLVISNLKTWSMTMPSDPLVRLLATKEIRWAGKEEFPGLFQPSRLPKSLFFALCQAAYRSPIQRDDTAARFGSRESVVMQTPIRSARIVSAIAAFSLASVALAQRPLRGGPDSPVPIAGAGGSGSPAPLGHIDLPSADTAPVRSGDTDRNPVRAAGSIVTQVQRALKQRGYYSGPVDGDAGGGTRAAIRGFRREKGMGSSTRIDGALVRALGI